MKKKTKNSKPDTFKKIIEISADGRSYFVVLSQIAAVSTIVSEPGSLWNLEIHLTSGKTLIVPASQVAIQDIIELLDAGVS